MIKILGFVVCGGWEGRVTSGSRGEDWKTNGVRGIRVSVQSALVREGILTVDLHGTALLYIILIVCFYNFWVLCRDQERVGRERDGV